MTKPFKPLTVNELLELDLPEPNWLVEGLIQEGTLVLLSAREKSGKGLLTIDLVSSLAEGVDFLGRSTDQGTAIYCATEETLAEVQSRILNRIGPIDEPPPVMVLPLDGSTGDTLNLAHPDSVDRLRATIEEHDPKLVVLDVLRELHDRKEDSADEMAPIVGVLRNLSHQTGTTIVVNHHMSKSGQARGSTAIGASVDAVMELRSHAEGFGNTALGGILTVKGRSIPKQDLNVNFGDNGRWTATGDPPPRAGRVPTRRRILSALLGSPRPLSVKQIAEQIEARETTVNNELGRMKTEDPPLVKATSSNRQGGALLYSLTHAGEVAAQDG